MIFRRPNPPTFFPAWACVGVVAAMCGIAIADQVVVGGIDHSRCKILGVENGKLRFRTAEGTRREAWIEDVDLIIVDRGGAYSDLNQAERFLFKGEPERAIARYRRTLRMVDEFWPDLIAARLLIAYDAAGRFEDAVESFIRVVQGSWTGSPVAARLVPQSIPSKRDGKVTRSLERIVGRLRQGTPLDDAQTALLRLLRYDILRNTSSRDHRLAAKTVALTPIPEAARSERTYTILLAALTETLQAEPSETAVATLNAAIQDCPEFTLPGFLLLKGRTLLRTAATRNDLVRAAWPFLRVAIHFEGHPLTPEALYDGAVAVERLDREDKAIELLTECLEHGHVTQETAKLATIALRRLQSAKTETG